MTNLERKASQDDNSLITRLEKLIDQKLNAVESSINRNVKSVEHNLNERISQLDKNLTSEIELNRALTSRLRAGLGTGLEKLFSQWLKRVLVNERGLTGFTIKNDVYFPDPKRIINPGSTQFEVDVVVDDPYIIAECTSFVTDKELEKVKKFVRIRNFLKPGCEAYFVTYGFDSKIAKESTKILEENGIIILNAIDIE